MQVHRDDMIAPGRLQHIGNELRRDGRPGLVLLVLPRVWEIRDHSCDAASACCFARVDHDEELHQAIVDLARGRGLEYKYFFFTKVSANTNPHQPLGMLEDKYRLHHARIRLS